MSLWAATANAPARLAQSTTGADGSFVVSVDQAPDGAILYLVSAGGTPAVSKQGGDNPAIALMTVLGSNPPAKVTINEMTTVASASIDPAGDVWASDNWQDEWSCYGKPDEGCFDPLWRPWDCRVQWHDL